MGTSRRVVSFCFRQSWGLSSVRDMNTVKGFAALIAALALTVVSSGCESSLAPLYSSCQRNMNGGTCDLRLEHSEGKPGSVSFEGSRLDDDMQLRGTFSLATGSATLTFTGQGEEDQESFELSAGTPLEVELLLPMQRDRAQDVDEEDRMIIHMSVTPHGTIEGFNGTVEYASQ